jgi:hypothetical protein
MLDSSGTALAPEPVGIDPPVGNDFFSFEAVDVTGTQRLLAQDVERDMPTEAVTRALAARMRLPDNVPWALRLDETSAFLDDQRPIGEQLSPGAHVTVVPKTHLGAGSSRLTG